MAETAEKKLLTVVVPVYCEEEVLGEFHSRIRSALEKLHDEFDLEFLFVNDGSTDRSLPMLLEMRDKDARVKVLDFSRNFGHQAAITAGIDESRGQATVIIDGDLQDPPEVIPFMVAKWQEGYQVVYGKRMARAGDPWIKRMLAHVFYRVIQAMSEVGLPADVGDFRLMDRAVVDVLKTMREENRYLRGMISWAGFAQCPVEYNRDRRYAGEAKYTFLRSLRLAIDGITSFSDRPLVYLTYGGMGITFLSVLFLVWTIVSKLIWPESAIVGWTSLMVVVVFFGGIQLMALGLVGQYLGRVYREVKGRPLYVVRRKHGLD